MNLPPRLQRWANRLAEEGHQVYITLTQNRTTMIRIQPLSRKTTYIRMHEQFSQAPLPVLKDLALTVQKRDAAAWKRVVAFAQTIHTHRDERRPITIQSKGEVFNLARELAYVKKTYFSEDLDAQITWGKRGAPQRRKRRSIRFGSWHEDEKLIRVHPLLDQDWVPREFIRYLIYHELCHAVAKPHCDPSGRQHVHHQDFKSLEAQYPRLKEMEAVSKEIFARLIKERK
jgi:predicted SprT family Zn-dependent metalloprotease